jgi:uncharacterized protein
MRIYLKEITENGIEQEGDESQAWVREALAPLDESPAQIPGHPSALRPSSLKTPAAARSSEVRFNLRRVDDVIMISGDFSTSIQLLCSRCASPFLKPFDEHFTAMYCKDKEMAGIAYLDQDSNPRGQNKGRARHAHDFDAPQGTEAAEDLEINYIAEDFVDLGQILTEQITVRIPFQPLCKEDCKGICANCGADLNVGRCACSKLTTKSPFASLKGFKVKE